MHSSPCSSSLSLAAQVLEVLWGVLVCRAETVRSWAELNELILVARNATIIIGPLQASPAVASVRPSVADTSSLPRSSPPSPVVDRVSFSCRSFGCFGFSPVVYFLVVPLGRPIASVVVCRR